MLSYQHLYHAGNAADVHKHAILSVILSYMMRKEKPLSYIETHGGRGLYDLAAAEAVKTGEAAMGVGLMLPRFPKAHPYPALVAKVRAQHGGAAYPGSPMIASLMHRPADAMHVAELHPQEFAALKEAMAPYPVQVHHRDGIELAMSMTPPSPRRGLVLIDPSYEVKSDYEQMPHVLYKLWKRWNVGVQMLWYPILTSGVHVQMTRVLDACNFPGALRHEVSFKAPKKGHGMVGSGVFVVNAPYGLDQEVRTIARVFRP